jgi:hypothetical protein
MASNQPLWATCHKVAQMWKFKPDIDDCEGAMRMRKNQLGYVPQPYRASVLVLPCCLFTSAGQRQT